MHVNHGELCSWPLIRDIVEVNIWFSVHWWVMDSFKRLKKSSKLARTFCCLRFHCPIVNRAKTMTSSPGYDWLGMGAEVKRQGSLFLGDQLKGRFADESLSSGPATLQ